ncbi:hypothetical protein [Paenibacillus urinalis]|uniref:Uncharacterized protein n=1 Tax=Paenibacillus urinalis TaxID=521520 RepID=A0AAX3MUU2_9BACL|nr:hypothetical protein [Paenibacillus urinalis]WDH81385.1 hypothetical protein PUW23_17860 [Paenibacillus urinalis]
MKSSNMQLSKLMGIVLVIAGFMMIVTKLSVEAGAEEFRIQVSGTGETINGTPQEKVLLYYSGEIINHGTKSFIIRSVEPILSEEAESLLVDPKAQILIYNTKVKPKDTLNIEGSFELDTSTQSEEEITDLLPGIIAYKVTYSDKESEIFPLYSETYLQNKKTR